jgi:hypothetical protein
LVLPRASQASIARRASWESILGEPHREEQQDRGKGMQTLYTSLPARQAYSCFEEAQEMLVDPRGLLAADLVLKSERPYGRDAVAALSDYLRQTATLMGTLALVLQRQAGNPETSIRVAAHLEFMAELIRQTLRMDEQEPGE